MGNFLERQSSAVIDGARYTYRIDEQGTACIEHCAASCSRVHIPEAIGGCPVTSIADSAFARQSRIEDIVCPCKLEHIGSRAFEGCLHLRSIALNDGLRSIGEGAFFLCTALGGLSVPASVERFGPRPLGTAPSAAMRKASPFEICFDPSAEHLFLDKHGVLYERRANGLVLVDGYRFEGETLACSPETVEIGPRALSGMTQLRRVVLPEGVKRIGDEAFRGSTGLARIDLPHSLESIGKAAFSCTRLESLTLPARCADVDDSAFAFGPIAADGSIGPFRSALGHVGVEDGNELFCMHGGLLCKRMSGGGLQAMLAPAASDLVEFGERIALVRDTALAGAHSIGTLRICDGVRFESERGLVTSGSIGVVEVVMPGRQPAATAFQLPRPGKRRFDVAEGLRGETFDARTFAAAYDRALSKMEDGLEQARLVVRRLACPAFLSADGDRAFRAFAESNLPAICAALGARGEFGLFELMADAGLLDASRTVQVAEALCARSDAHAIGYLLAMRRRRFDAATWDDYDI